MIVAIPARDEAEEIAPCLLSLAAQQGGGVDAAVLCLNNCTDDTAAIVRGLSLPFALHAIEVELPPAAACAGVARRIAMDRAAAVAGERGALLTTDADARVPPDWVAANLAALRQGAEAVAGQAAIEPVGAMLIPAHLHAADAAECDYAALLDEIGALLDPDPADPWPRHDEHAGASIAVTPAAYRRAGGIPPVPLAEDRAFFAALRRVDARIRHARDVRVVVSARTVGRAAGGMADTMRRRMVAADAFLDERLEPVRDAARRASLRAWLRRLWSAETRSPGASSLLAMRLSLPREELATLLATRYFGEAWAEVEACSAMLRRRHRVPVVDRPAQAALARRLRDGLRARAAFRPGAGRSDTLRYAAAGPA